MNSVRKLLQGIEFAENGACYVCKSVGVHVNSCPIRRALEMLPDDNVDKLKRGKVGTCKVHGNVRLPEPCGFCLQSELEGKSDAWHEALYQFKQRVATSLEWMVAGIKYRHDLTHSNLEPGSQGGYSDELNTAIDLLEELRQV